MVDGGTGAVFVDLDGTLYDGYIWIALTRHHIFHRMKLPTLAFYLGLHLPLWPMLRLQLISPGTFYETWGSNMAWLIRGVSVDQALGIWDWLIDREILPAIRTEILSAIQNHQAEGLPVILLSGTFQPLLDRLARRLGLEGAIATPLIQRDGKYLGRIQPPLNVGLGKLERIASYRYQTGGGVDLASSYMYTDSIVDRPVLETVGHPVVVYPDHDLARLASARSWPIITS